MRKWMLVTVLALGLCLFLLPGYALAELTVNIFGPTTAVLHGATVPLRVELSITEGSTYFLEYTLTLPDETPIYRSMTGTAFNDGYAWTIFNGTERSYLLTITARACDPSDHSKVVYTNTKYYQIQIDHEPLPEWEVTASPTCAAAGTRVKRCKYCKKILETETIPATGVHTPGDYTVTTPATCGTEGTETQSCTVCGQILNTRPIPATGLHKADGVWTHTAGTAGLGSRHTGTCQVCGAKLEEDCSFRDEVIPPTCTGEGYTRHTCTLCGFTYTDSPVKAKGHTPGEWVTVKEATNKKEGLSELYCTVCGEKIGSQVIKRKSEWWRDNTACALGVRLRDEKPDVTDKWYMLALVDLTKDGVQEFPLIASNAYVIGSVYVTVDKGTAAVRYELGTKEAAVKEEYLAWFGSMDDIKTADMEEAPSQAEIISQPVNMAERFPGAKSAYLLFRLKLDYDIFADGVKRFYEGQYR